METIQKGPNWLMVLEHARNALLAKLYTFDRLIGSHIPADRSFALRMKGHGIIQHDRILNNRPAIKGK